MQIYMNTEKNQSSKQKKRSGSKRKRGRDAKPKLARRRHRGDTRGPRLYRSCTATVRTETVCTETELDSVTWHRKRKQININKSQKLLWKKGWGGGRGGGFIWFLGKVWQNDNLWAVGYLNLVILSFATTAFIPGTFGKWQFVATGNFLGAPHFLGPKSGCVSIEGNFGWHNPMDPIYYHALHAFFYFTTSAKTLFIWFPQTQVRQMTIFCKVAAVCVNPGF